MYDIFNVLVNQFHAFLSKDNYVYNKYDFNDFFHKCHRYFFDVLINSNNKSITLKIILCMIGFLSIDKQNFDRLNQYSNRFVNQIMSCVRKDFDMV